jgi:hypothetical protein
VRVTCSATLSNRVTLTLRAEPSGRHLVLQPVLRADEVFSKHEKHETELSDQNSHMTTRAKLLSSAVIAQVAPDRDYDQWLKAHPDHSPIDRLRPYDADKMTAWKVDRRSET